MRIILKKLKYLFSGYNPYPFYWFDLLTERHVKNRGGECFDCLECCKYNCDCCKSHTSDCFCKHVDLEKKRCRIYDIRTCNVWFPVSKKEIDIRIKFQPEFKCKFIFKSE
jgi:hypothetical protein